MAIAVFVASIDQESSLAGYISGPPPDSDWRKLPGHKLTFQSARSAGQQKGGQVVSTLWAIRTGPRAACQLICLSMLSYSWTVRILAGRLCCDWPSSFHGVSYGRQAYTWSADGTWLYIAMVQMGGAVGQRGTVNSSVGMLCTAVGTLLLRLWHCTCICTPLLSMHTCTMSCMYATSCNHKLESSNPLDQEEPLRCKR